MYISRTGPKVIQSNHMVIKNYGHVCFHLNTDMHWMLDKWKLAQLINLNRQDLCSDSPNRMMPLADARLKTEPPEH